MVVVQPCHLKHLQFYNSNAHAISYELDIAVLLVPDSVTWKKKLRPLRLALKVPHLRQDVLVAGFPEG